MSQGRFVIPPGDYDLRLPPAPQGPRPKKLPNFHPRGPGKGFGRKAPKLPKLPKLPGRFLPGLGGLLFYGPDLLDGLLPYQHPEPYYVPGPWKKVWDCGTRWNAPPYSDSASFGPYMHILNGKTPANAGYCIAGQAYTSATPWGTAWNTTSGAFTLLLLSRKSGPVRYRNDAWWWKEAGPSGLVKPQYHEWTAVPLPMENPMPDPNWLRNAPAAAPDLVPGFAEPLPFELDPGAIPLSQPKPLPFVQTPHGVPLPVPGQAPGVAPWPGEVPAPRPAPNPNPSTNPGANPGSGVQPGVQPNPGTVPNTGTPTVPDVWQWTDAAPDEYVRPHERARPRTREKEKKIISRTRAVAIATFKALDAMSESCDVVDAIYDALPTDVKQRWNRRNPKRRGVDNFGQYGIGGCDWKLKALYHNIDKLDVVAAFKNIIANEAEDRYYGMAHKSLPRGGDSGGALDAQFKAFPEQISKFLETLGF